MTPAARHLRNLIRVICASLSRTGVVADTAKELHLSPAVIRQSLIHANRAGLLHSTYILRVIKHRRRFQELVKSLVSVWQNDHKSKREPSPGPEIIEVSFDQAARMKQVYALYNELGTLNAVGDKMGITRERVRQILKKGSRLGLFNYETSTRKRLRHLQETLDKRTLALMLQKNSAVDLARQYGVGYSTILKLCRRHMIETKELQLEERRRRCLTRYMEVVERLGEHPSTTVLQRIAGGRVLHQKILTLWDSIARFRRAYGIQFAPKTKTPTWLNANGLRSAIERARQRKQERINRFLDAVRQSPGVTLSTLCASLNMKRNLLYRYVKEQKELGAIAVKRAEDQKGQPSLLFLLQDGELDPEGRVVSGGKFQMERTNRDTREESQYLPFRKEL